VRGLVCRTCFDGADFSACAICQRRIDADDPFLTASRPRPPRGATAAFAWPLLVQAGGLAEITGGKLQLTTKGRAALGKPAAGVLQALWRSLLAKGLIDEFSRVENIKGQRAANVLTAPKARRQTVAEALAGQPVGEWVEIADLFGQMKLTTWSPRVERSERALWKLYVGCCSSTRRLSV